MQSYYEIACDESGFSGTNMLDPDNQVFTHASVDLDPAAAAAFVDEVRRRFPYAASEYKSGQIQGPAIAWLLGPAGPLPGRAHVHLSDKTYFTLVRVVDLFIGEPTFAGGTSLGDPQTRELALVLYRDGRTVYGRGPWRAFLQSFVTLMRSKRQWVSATDENRYFRAVAGLRAEGELGEIAGLLRQGRSRMASLRTRLQYDPGVPPPLEPLLPALLETVRYWSERAGTVTVVHDEQSALTAGRVRQIQYLLDGRLHAVHRVDSKQDPRVQVADFLAGAARRIAAAELRGDGDPELTGLLRPYVDPNSIWPGARMAR